MSKKTVTSALAGAALLFGLGFAGSAPATFMSCVGVNYDITDKVDPNEGCTILEPLDANVNDSVSGDPETFTVNIEKFFGFDDWLFDGKYDSAGDPPVFTDNSLLFSFTGDGQSGTFSKVGDWSFADIMFVFKDGGSTNLVGYLIDMDALLSPAFNNVGTYESPFVIPPFSFTGEPPRDISHISVYFRDAEEPEEPPEQIPEPGTLVLLGSGLFGLWALRRRSTKA